MRQQITVFGANGKVGRYVVQEALRRDYTVVAFVHRHTKLRATSQLKIVQGDIYQREDVARALVGSHMVISALGSWGTPQKDVLTRGITHIIEAMHASGITTIVSLTGGDARASGDQLGLIHRVMHSLLGRLIGKILIDGERHIALLEGSHLDWTVIRSPIMLPLAVRLQYRLSMKRPLPWAIVGRQLVALAMVDAIKDRTWRHKAPFIS
jgi:putative NADH-flavin reductase